MPPARAPNDSFADAEIYYSPGKTLRAAAFGEISAGGSHYPGLERGATIFFEAGALLCRRRSAIHRPQREPN